MIPKSEAKGKRLVRVVYLTDQALNITCRLMLKHPEGKLFRSSSGRAWSPDSVNSAFDRIQTRIGQRVMRARGIEVSEDEIEALVPALAPVKIEAGVLRDKTSAELRNEAKRKHIRRLAASLAPRYSLYALRHSWATHGLEKGVDPITVGVLMGHSDPTTLAKTCQHVAKKPAYMLSQARKAAARA